MDILRPKSIIFSEILALLNDNLESKMTILQEKNVI